MTRYFALAAIAAGTLLAGCGGQVRPQRVPDLRGERLDAAEDRLDDLGLRYETVGGGALGIVVRSHWAVCSQDPRPGRLATRVVLTVDRDCWNTDEGDFDD